MVRAVGWLSVSYQWDRCVCSQGCLVGTCGVVVCVVFSGYVWGGCVFSGWVPVGWLCL